MVGLLIFILIATAAIGFLPSISRLWDKEKKTFTINGYLYYFLVLALIIASYIQYDFTDTANKNHESDLKKERDSANAAIRKGIDSGINSNNVLLAAAFKKQSIDIDSLKAKTINIDSSKNIINNFSQTDPTLFIEENAIKFDSSDKSHFKFKIKSSDAGATNFEIITYVYSEYSDGSSNLSRGINIDKTLKIPKDREWETGWSLFPKQFSSFYIYLKGKYTNLDNTKTYHIDDLYSYNAVSKVVSIPINSQRKRILEIIQSVPENKLAPLK